MRIKTLCIILFFVTACSTPKPNELFESDPACSLPCWKNIRPGETTQDEAIQIINAFEEVDNERVHLFNEPWNVLDGHILFYLGSTPRTAIVGRIFSKNEKVVELRFTSNLDVTFGEMVEKSSEPEIVISMLYVKGGSYLMGLSPSRGIGYAFYPRPTTVLKSTTQIAFLVLFDPAYYEILLNNGVFSPRGENAKEIQSHMYSWKGYGNISELYPPEGTP